MKQLTSALDANKRLEPIEYNQTRSSVEQYTEDTPQFDQCGFIAQSVQQIEKLQCAMIGVEVGDDGKETVRFCFQKV